jgi:uncharacterized membrane protein
MALTHVIVLGLGALLMAIPVVLHLLMQPKPKPMVFPAIRFVQTMQRTSQRNLRLRHWLLLLLRCLLLLAVAAAFAKPSTTSAAFGNWLGAGGGAVLSVACGLLLAWALLATKPVNLPLAAIVAAVLAMLLTWTGYSLLAALGKDTGQLLTDRLAPVATMVIVDSSPRMQYRYQNMTLLQRAQEEGRSIISQLPPDSQAGVIQNDGQPPFFSVDIGAARKRLDTLETSFASTSLPETIEAAARFLRDVPLERKEIYVISDMTRSGWNTADDSLRRFLEERPDISLYLLDVGVEAPVNFSLDQLELSPTSVPENGSFTVTAQLRAAGPGDSLVVRLFLEKPDPARPVRRDGKTLLPEEHWTRAANVTVADNSTTSISLTMQENLPPGIHHGWIELESSDSLAVDNRQYFTIEVRPAWKVLVAHPDDVDPGNLVDALVPDDDQAGAIYEVTVVSQRNLAQQLLEDYSAVFILDPKPASDSTWKILESYVRGGGGLGIFLGHNAADGSQPDAAFQSSEAATVLPGKLERLWRSPSTAADGRELIVSIDDLSHPVVADFRPYASLGIWQPFPVFRHWELETSDDPLVQVIARFSDGIPFLLERKIGNGHVICATTPITESASALRNTRRSWNDLFNSAQGEVWPAWLLVTSISRYLSSGTRDRLNLQAGQTATLQNDRDSMPIEYRLYSPLDGEPLRITANDNSVRYKFTDVPGTYRLKGRGEGEGAVLRGFSVNLAAGTTDLQRVEPAAMESLLGKGRYQLARRRDELQQQQGTTRLGQEFYPVLALLMSLLLALELIMSNRFYKN